MAHLDLRALGVPQAAPLGPLAGGVHDALADDLFVSLDRAATEPARCGCAQTRRAACQDARGAALRGRACAARTAR
jgi:hypothetical protein